MLGTSADHEEHGRKAEAELNLRAQTSTGRLAHRKRPLASCIKQLSVGEMVALLKVHRAGCKAAWRHECWMQHSELAQLLLVLLR